ncbi:MAG: hypothetical protein M0P16_11445 [Syntrophales bacterium]|jgi:hypothetical protein|nr:hypothetical protein [Syntrophales bacterium]MCK9393085.1 hypothetical protein [Syntrophales bacterium]
MSLASDLLEKLDKLSPNRKIYLTIIVEQQESLLLESFNDQTITEQQEKISGTNLIARYDAENTNTLTAAHYTILLKNKEVLAVGLGGQAHHKRNRGIKVQNKVATFLRQKGVKLPANNILEQCNLDATKYFSIINFEL